MELIETTAATPGLATLLQLYGFAGDAAQFAISHIDMLKQADNALANRCGQVLEAANSGFGVGHETALILVGVGQRLLGNPLIGGLVVSASGNPIVMTCAAIGAIHYGWKAMSDSEREQFLAAVGSAFRIGVELVRSIASFAFDLIQTLMSRENFEELKRMVSNAAEALGRHLSDITRLLSDRIWESAHYVYTTAEGAASSAWARVPNIRRSTETKPGDIQTD
jgi:hypothetical protein